jgi:hypothetical protein
MARKPHAAAVATTTSPRRITTGQRRFSFKRTQGLHTHSPRHSPMKNDRRNETSFMNTQFLPGSCQAGEVSQVRSAVQYSTVHWI